MADSIQCETGIVGGGLVGLCAALALQHTGPLAFLPLANGQCSIVGSCDNEFAEQLMTADDTDFCQNLSIAFERQPKSETALATHSFSGLKWIYGENDWSINRFRNLGMRLVQTNPACRRMLMQQALRNMA